MRLRRWMSTSVVAIMAMSCSDPGADSHTPVRYTSTDSAGVDLAVTLWTDPPPSTGWTVGLVPRVVFGQSDTDFVGFYEIDDAVRLSDGRVVVLDAGAKELLYFSSSGEFQARAGGTGDGPGEFRDPAGLVRLPGDTLCVYARRSQHLSLFDQAGNWIVDRAMDEIEELPPTQLFRLADAHDGSVIIHNPTGFYVRVDEEEGPVDNPNFRFATDGTYEGVVGEPSTMWIHATRILFDGARVTDAAGGRLYVRDPARYEIRVYDYAGELLRIHRLTRPGRPTAEEDRERYKEHLRNDVQNPPLLERLIAGVDGATLADSFPAIDRFHVDSLGNIWVRDYSPPWETDATTGVFSADGPWLGTVHLPPDLRLLEIGADYLLGVRTDELDVQHLVLYDLER